MMMRVIEDTSWNFTKESIKTKPVQPVHVDACFEVVAAAENLGCAPAGANMHGEHDHKIYSDHKPKRQKEKRKTKFHGKPLFTIMKQSFPWAC
jgi:hypothetical protein